ncbi:MAG: ABC transporter substrate-binding protein [Bauldia sp.]|nr:ABC transporter substrate-binding protein [Bauldia sp.]
MLRSALVLAGGLAVFAAATLPAAAQDAPACEIDRPIVFAGLGYDSAEFHNAVASFILEHGYGCETDEIPGETIPLINGLARGDIDVIMEIWTGNPAPPWVAAVEAGTAVPVGSNFPDATEGWFVPRYVVEGDGAVAPGLRSVADLPDYKALFADPEEPGMGRFYNCPAGQVCEAINTKKLAAYGLDDDFTNFRVGNDAVAGAVEAAVLRNEPVLFYYYGPTWLLGKYDFYQLEEPPFDAAIWDALVASDNPTEATAYPVSNVIVGANAAFAAGAPGIIAFLEAYETSSAIVSQALAWMQANDASPEEAAVAFITANRDIWGAWVSDDIADRVAAAAD